MTATLTFEEALYWALVRARDAQLVAPTREKAIVITKLEEAVMWNDAGRVDAGLPALGLKWRG